MPSAATASRASCSERPASSGSSAVRGPSDSTSSTSVPRRASPVGDWLSTAPAGTSRSLARSSATATRKPACSSAVRASVTGTPVTAGTGVTGATTRSHVTHPPAATTTASSSATSGRSHRLRSCRPSSPIAIVIGSSSSIEVACDPSMRSLLDAVRRSIVSGPSGTASSSARTSAPASRKRSLGVAAVARATSSSRWRETDGTVREGGGTGSTPCCTATACGESPVNGVLPVRHSYRTHPSAYTSARASSG